MKVYPIAKQVNMDLVTNLLIMEAPEYQTA